ncbi:hypothetical protein [Herbaspirillum lusitanum]|uniref:hypothetical protein n=1 Tax=Herbaspirillum lusitanum TaxID=213312 RepID=UPI001389BD2D|nr:hypothetical protein [Herbaspirillum lusitanum]
MTTLEIHFVHSFHGLARLLFEFHRIPHLFGGKKKGVPPACTESCRKTPLSWMDPTAIGRIVHCANLALMQTIQQRACQAHGKARESRAVHGHGGNPPWPDGKQKGRN